MTASADAGSGLQGRVARRKGPTWPRVAVVGALLVLAFFVSRSCQQAQIRVTKDQAIATAKQQVDFKPKLTQIRLLRQGLNRKPFWFVSLSIPIGRADKPEGFARLTVVKVDANNGKVNGVDNQITAKDAGRKKGP